MIDFDLTEEQLAIQHAAREFAQKEIKPIAGELDKIADPKEGFPWDIHVKANQLGFNKILIPKEYGGLGLTDLDACVVIEELSAADAGIGTSYFVHCGLTRMLADTGTEEQKKEFFGSCCNDPKDRYFFALASTEHGTAGDLGPRDYAAGRAKTKKLTLADFATSQTIPGAQRREVTTIARRDGDYWVINGMKRFITFGRQARLYLTTVKTNPDEPDSRVADAFLVPAGTPGLSFGHVEDKMGLRLSENSEVIFEDVRVPEKWRCNINGSYAKRGMILNTLTAAVCVGLARRAFEESIAYAQTRYKGGALIIHHQAVQRMLTDMAANVKTARLLTWWAAWQSEKGKTYTVLPNMAKVFASEACLDTCTKAMQVFGGYGYMHDFPIEKLVRDAHVMPIYDGSNEMMRHLVILPKLAVEGTA